jgi:indole-3-acetate monooxygenase
VVEEIASHDASTCWCVEQANGCSMVAAFLDPEVAHEIFGPSDGIVELARNAITGQAGYRIGGWPGGCR